VSGVAQALLALAYGFGSAGVPLLNAEAFALVSAARETPAAAVAVVLALAVGQTAGKLLLFEAARRGSTRLTRRFHRRRDGRAARWTARAESTLTARSTGLPLVLASACVGLPPLAAVSLAAGASGQRRRDFGVACLCGRTARFALLALPAAWALG